MGDIIGLIIFGAILGALARFFLKGSQNIGVIMTIILGILGAVAGYYIAGALGVASTKGIDWIRDIISVIAAMIFISVYVGIKNRAEVSR